MRQMKTRANRSGVQFRNLTSLLVQQPAEWGLGVCVFVSGGGGGSEVLGCTRQDFVSPLLQIMLENPVKRA